MWGDALIRAWWDGRKKYVPQLDYQQLDCQQFIASSSIVSSQNFAEERAKGVSKG